MNPDQALRQFVDDELLRAPLQIEQTLEGTLAALAAGSRGLSMGERMVASELAQAIQGQRRHLVDAYVRSLREQMEGELSGAAPASAPMTAPRELSLSLVDETEVAADVEISRATELVRSVAEHELRELQTFISALVGDMDVAGDHNPMRPETCVRALWAAAHALPVSRGYQVALMRHAAAPLAQVLRKSYAGACSRLESAGIEPAAYRTLILPGGQRRARPGSAESTYAPRLAEIRATMPAPHDDGAAAAPSSRALPLDQALRQAEQQLRSLPAEAGPTEMGRLRASQREQLVRSAASPVDQQLVELLSRLFDTILASRRLAADVQLLVSRLQASVLRLALHDASMLEDYGHAVWRFVDRVAFLADTLPPMGDPERSRTMRLAQGVIEHLVGATDASPATYEWAIGRLQAVSQHRLEQRCVAEAARIAQLETLEARLASPTAPPTTMAGALDAAQLDTVPADLLPEAASPGDTEALAQRWLDEQEPGAWWRLFLQGRWIHAQLLWHGERREVWLLADGRSEAVWGMRRGALATLHREQLVGTLQMRSLVRRAARKLLRELAPGAPD